MRVYTLFHAQCFDRALTIHIQEGILPSVFGGRIHHGGEWKGQSRPITDPEFRVSACVMRTDDFSVKAGFNTMRQYIIGYRILPL